VCGSKQHAFAGVGEEILESLDKAKSVIPLNHKVFLEVTMKLKDADRPKVTSKKVLVYRKTDKLTLIDDTETHIRRVQNEDGWFIVKQHPATKRWAFLGSSQTDGGSFSLPARQLELLDPAARFSDGNILMRYRNGGLIINEVKTDGVNRSLICSLVGDYKGTRYSFPFTANLRPSPGGQWLPSEYRLTDAGCENVIIYEWSSSGSNAPLPVKIVDTRNFLNGNTERATVRLEPLTDKLNPDECRKEWYGITDLTVAPNSESGSSGRWNQVVVMSVGGLLLIGTSVLLRWFVVRRRRAVVV